MEWPMAVRTWVEGRARGPLLRLDEPLSMWGGFDPADGGIVDVHHPQYGESMTGRMVFLPACRGSAGTPAALAESLRSGVGASGFILGHAEVNLVTGVWVANRLYASEIPVVQLRAEQLDGIESGRWLRIEAGELHLETEPLSSGP